MACAICFPFYPGSTDGSNNYKDKNNSSYICDKCFAYIAKFASYKYPSFHFIDEVQKDLVTYPI